MSNITLTVPNDDDNALFHFGKSLVDMSATLNGTQYVILEKDEYDKLVHLRTATGYLQQASPRTMQELRGEGEELQGKRKEPEIDTTAQQVESLAVPMGDNEEQTPPTTDKTNTPWDERIHSASKALNADGTWRLRRKPKDMDEAEWSDYIKWVQDDIHLTSDEEVETPEPVAVEPTREEVEPPVTPPGDDYHTDTDVVTEQTVAGIPPIPVPPPVVPPTDWTFPKLMTFLTERQGKIDVATVNMLLAQDGIASLPELNAHPDKIGPFVARVKAHLGE